jgi:hypothetical protein
MRIFRAIEDSRLQQRGIGMTMRALVSADRPVVRIWHPDNPKMYVEIEFESQDAANAAVEQLNGMLMYATGLEFGEDAQS